MYDSEAVDNAGGSGGGGGSGSGGGGGSLWRMKTVFKRRFLTRKGPRGRMSRMSFEDCVMFHLLTVFPNNAAEQESHERAEETPARQHSFWLPSENRHQE